MDEDKVILFLSRLDTNLLQDFWGRRGKLLSKKGKFTHAEASNNIHLLILILRYSFPEQGCNTGTLTRTAGISSEKPATASIDMHGSPTPTTPRGTPSRRGRSPRFVADSPSQSGSTTLPSNFPDKPTSTFTSSLDIRVEGATSFDSDSEKETDLTEPERAPTSESKRAPRKSKTEALAALNSHARSTSPNPDDDGYRDGVSVKDWNTTPIPVSPVLDLSSVKTSSSRPKIMDKAPRPFGLEDCPEYYPTMEEFKDPMAYIRSISDEAKNYGICKVVPPAEWEMPFVTDTEVRGLPCINSAHSDCSAPSRVFVLGLDFSGLTPSRPHLGPN